ncbi:MAG TPA: glycosyltransferase [Methanoregulaceae archaeon]|nr:glycosyltransferase [Methanoregulaceae archaeon]
MDGTKNGTRLRIIHFPSLTSGNSYGLSRAERLLGMTSDVMVFEASRYGYPADITIFSGKPHSLLRWVFRFFTLSVTLGKILFKYKIFHINSSQSLIDFPEFNLHLLDLPLFRLRGKLFVTFNGCDARQKYPTIQRYRISACQFDECYDGVCMDGSHDERNRTRIEKIDRYADGIFAVSPDLMAFLPERTVFLPVTIATWDALDNRYPADIPERIVIAHAPTDRGAKGTPIILEALAEIKARYPDRVEILLIEGQSHQDTLKALARAHLVIDQVLIGWYGALAVEAMKMGIPVMAYIRPDDLVHLPPEIAKACLASIITVDLDTLGSRLIQIINDPSILLHYSEMGHQYVQNYHHPKKVAQITVEAYRKASRGIRNPGKVKGHSYDQN